MDGISLDQFRSAFQTGGLRSVGVLARGGVFFVTGRPRSGELVVLATSRGKQARSFRDAGNAIAVLHRIGARKVEVDLAEWVPEQIGETKRRPDTAERQRRAHEAAAHDAWFRAEVEQSLAEADGPETEWLSNEEVKRQSSDHRARWRAAASRGS